MKINKILFIPLIISLCLIAYVIGYSTVIKTTNLELFKPAAEDTTVDWFNTMNDNLDLIDAIFDDVSLTEFGYLDGVTSAIQTQINNKQPLDAGLTSIAGLTTAANKSIYTTALDTYATYDLTAFGRSLVDDANASAARTTLDLVIGTNVQAWDTQLDDIAALAITDNNFIVGNGTNWVAESGATARTSLGIDLSLYYLKTDIDTFAELDAIVADKTLVNITNKLSAFAATTSAELAGVISDETGTGALVFGTSPAITTPTGIVKGDVGLGNVENLKAKLDATTAPAVGNDNTQGYAIGSRWIDVTNDKEYVCLDVSTGAAVWTETTQAGGGTTTFTGLTDTPANYTGSAGLFA